MNACHERPVSKRAIRSHYDLATPLYRLLWGPHIHHGLWEGDETPERAQEQLVERLAARARIEPGSDILDVGCGMAGSAVYLARRLGCRVTGLTLSPVQQLWGQFAAWRGGVASRVRVACMDAEEAEFPAASFDVLWSVECTEHLFDRAAFFQRAAAWLRPGGRVALCAWLAADRPHDPATARQVEAVCRGFLCPSLGTAGDYLDAFQQAGLVEGRHLDLTEQVTRTWEICRERVQRGWVRLLAGWGGLDMVRFLDHFDVILRAYRSGAMHYGCFTARRER